MLRKTIATVAMGGAMLITTVIGTGVASAATTPALTGYGFDGNAHLIVGGGSTTVYKLASSLAQLWDSTASCSTQNSFYNPTTGTYPQPAINSGTAGAAFNQCASSSTTSSSTQPYTGVNAGGNYDGDTVAIASPTGSSDGIASLNSDHDSTTNQTFAYEGTNATIATQDGTDNGYGTVDFALSSRAAKLSGGNCALPGPQGPNDEEACDTFWGIAADGVQVFSWGSTPTGLNADNGLTANDLYNIWNCTYTTWGQLPEYSVDAAADPSFPPSDAPIVPWSMNSGSGTYADFNNYIIANATGAPSSFTVNTGCARELSTGAQPLENDTKPLLEDVGAANLSTSPTSNDNPDNWIWFGSNGLLSAFPYLSNPTLFGTTYNTSAIEVAGTTPSQATIHAGTYAIPRVLNLVTANSDVTCPENAADNGCTFGTGPTNGNGTTDLDLKGPSTFNGKSGAIEEFIRFVCRDKTQSVVAGSSPTVNEPTDPYTGVSDLSEIAAAVTNSGFAALPTKDITAGSNCDVQAYQ